MVGEALTNCSQVNQFAQKVVEGCLFVDLRRQHGDEIEAQGNGEFRNL